MSALGAAYFPEYDLQGESVTSIKFAPIDRHLAIGGRVGSCRIYDTGTWKMAGQRTFPACVSFIAFSNVEDSVAIGYGQSVETWNCSLRQRRQSMELAAAGEVSCGIMTADGKRLIVGCKSREIVVLNLATGRPVAVLTAHTGAVTALALSPDGKTLASTSIDGSVRLWDMETMREIGILGRHVGRANGVVFSADGNTLYSVGDGDDSAHNVFLIWNARNDHRTNP
jgi:WD40 repeat protein